MKKLLIYWLMVFAAMWCLSSCGPQYYLRRALAKGLRIDTTIVQKFDTVRIKELSEHVKIVKEVDTLTIESDCADLVKQVSKPERKKSLTKLQNDICPDFFRQFDDKLHLQIEGHNFYLPISMWVESKGGTFEGGLVMKEFSQIYVKEEIKTAHLVVGDTTWKNITDGLVGAGLLLLVLILLFVWSRFRGWL